MKSKTSHITIFLAIGKILAMIMNLVTPLFLTRYLSKGDYGIYSQFNTVFLFLSSVLGMGLQSNLYFFYPSTKDKTECSKLLGNTFSLLSVCVSIGLLIVVIPPISHWLLGDSGLNKFIGIILLTTWLNVPTRILDPLFTLNGDRNASMFFPPIEVIGKVILIIFFALLFNTLEGILWSVCVFQAGCYLYSLIYAARSGMPFCFWQSFDKNICRKQLSYSIPFGVAVLLNTLCSRLDKIICISYLTIEDYAIYSLAFFGIPGIMQVYDSLCQVNVMEMSKAYHGADNYRILELYKSFVVKTLSFSLPIILIVFLFSRQIIILLFTEKYSESVPFFQIYILTFIVAMLGAGTILRAINHTRRSMYAYALSTIIFIPSSFYLIRFYGMWGAMGSALIGNLLPRIFQIMIEMKLMHCSIADYFPIRKILKIILISFLCLVPVVWLNHTFLLNVWICAIVGFIYIILVYALELLIDVFLINKQISLHYIHGIRKYFKGNDQN